MTSELRAFAEERGGAVVVRSRRDRGYRGVPFLEVTAGEPATLADADLFVVGGIAVHLLLPVRRRPQVLHLSMAGRRRRRPVASWDGCAFVV